MVNYYTVDITAWTEGTYGFSFEEEHVYRKLCEHIYKKDDRLLDDDRDNAALCKMSAKRYRRHRQTLLDAGKITLDDGHIRNDRCTQELQRIFEKSEKAREKAKKSHAKRRRNKNEKIVSSAKKPSKNNGTEVAVATAPVIAPALANRELVIEKEPVPSEQGAGIPFGKNISSETWAFGKELVGDGMVGKAVKAGMEEADLRQALLASADKKPPIKYFLGCIRQFENTPKLSPIRQEEIAERAQSMRELDDGEDLFG